MQKMQQHLHNTTQNKQNMPTMRQKIQKNKNIQTQMKIKPITTNEENQEFKAFDDKLEVLRFISSVHSRIKDEITSDFILAKLTEQDKNYIIEMTTNAYFMKAIYDYMLVRLHQQKNKYDQETYQETTKLINKISGSLFKNFMIKNYLIADLSRNNSENPMLSILGQYQLTPETPEPTTQQKIIDKLKPQNE